MGEEVDQRRTCSVEGCNERHKRRGMCATHVYLMTRFGSTERRQKTRRGEALAFATSALIHDGDGCLTWPYARTASGYAKLRFAGSVVEAHRWVCERVNGAPPTPEHDAAHNCGKGHEGCIAPGHLRWATPTENAADRTTHGTEGSSGKLTEDQAREIVGLKGLASPREIARQYGLAPGTVRSIQAGRSWKHLQGASHA